MIRVYNSYVFYLFFEKKKLVFVANFKKSLSLNYYRIRVILGAQGLNMCGEDNGKFFFSKTNFFIVKYWHGDSLSVNTKCSAVLPDFVGPTVCKCA